MARTLYPRVFVLKYTLFMLFTLELGENLILDSFILGLIEILNSALSHHEYFLSRDILNFNVVKIWVYCHCEIARQSPGRGGPG